MKKPFFSIIIPCLNEEHYIPQLLRDIEKQKDKNFEVIVVDSMSFDATKEKVLTFSHLFPLTFIQVRKQNVAYQRNTGAKKAKGTYLIFLDADARIKSSFTKKIIQTINKKKGLLFLPFLIADDTSQKNKIVFSLVNSIIEASQSFSKPLSSGGSLIIERNVFQTLGGYDKRIYVAEDHSFIQKAQKWGIRAQMIKEAKVVFSLRRMRREGQLQLLYKYLLVTLHIFITGEIKSKIIHYEMGGQRYKSKETLGVLKKDPKRMKYFLRHITSLLN